MQLYLRRARYMAGGSFDALIRQEQRKLQGLATPALYRITVQTILSSTVDEPEVFARRITYLRSYLGAFRSGDTVYLSGKLVHFQDGVHGGFGIELTPWSVSRSYLANLTG